MKVHRLHTSITVEVSEFSQTFTLVPLPGIRDTYSILTTRMVGAAYFIL